MAITLDAATYRILVPKADLAVVAAPSFYDLDVDAFRLTLRNLEDDPDNAALPKTHDHNTELDVAGLVLARQVLIRAPWVVEFEDGAYQVTCKGANHNIGVRRVFNSVSLNANLSAGLQIVTSGSGVTAQDKLDIAAEVWNSILAAGLTAGELMHIQSAVLAAKINNAAGPTVKVRKLDDSGDIVSADVDAQGNRTAVTLTP